METVKKEDIKINPENLKIDTSTTDAGGMEKTAFEEKYGEKIENISNLQTAVADKVPEEKKGLFAKLKAGFEKVFAKSPEQLQKDLEETMAKAELRLYGNPNLQNEYNVILTSKGEEKAKEFVKERANLPYESVFGNKTLRDLYEKYKQEGEEKSQKFKIAIGKFFSVVWNETKNDFIDKTNYKNPVGEASNQSE